MLINPILKKEVKVSSRSFKLCISVLAYEGLLLAALMMGLYIINNEFSGYSYFYNDDNVYSYLQYLFPVLAIAQTCVVALIMPIMTSTAISGEKERQTFDIMATTCMSPLSIVMGKVMASMAQILLYIVASIPILSLPFVVGGLSWSSLLYYLLSLILFCFLAGSIGILASATFNKSIISIVMSFVLEAVICGFTFLPLVFAIISSDGDHIGESSLPLLFNPVIFFEEIFMHMFTGESLFGGGYQNSGISYSGAGPITQFLTTGYVWIFVSAACIFVLSMGFILLAAYKTNPLNTSAKKRKKKKNVD